MAIKDFKKTRMERRLQDKTPKKGWKKILFVSLLVIGVFAGLFLFFLYDFFLNDTSVPIFDRLNPKKGGDSVPFTKLNILIIGYDSELNGRPRSDTLMLASFDIKEKAVGILSIPRDTRVMIPGNDVYSKINSAFAKGGSEKAVEAVSSFLGVPIQYYIATNFDGFAQMVNTLGGIEIDVKNDMWYEDKAGGLYIDIKKGKQVLTGEQAIGYVRYRDDYTADLGRIQRQQDFIKQAINQFLTPELVMKLPTLLNQFSQSIKTDMSLTDLANLGKLVKDIKRENIKTATLPGEGGNVNGVAYFLHDKEGTQKIVHELIASKEYVANSKYKIGVFNGSGTSRVANITADDLKLYGFTIEKIANADNYNYEKTLVVYTKELTQEITDLGKNLNAEVKSLTETSYAENESMNALDALVIVGKDFKGESR